MYKHLPLLVWSLMGILSLGSLPPSTLAGEIAPHAAYERIQQEGREVSGSLTDRILSYESLLGDTRELAELLLEDLESYRAESEGLNEGLSQDQTTYEKLTEQRTSLLRAMESTRAQMRALERITVESEQKLIAHYKAGLKERERHQVAMAEQNYLISQRAQVLSESIPYPEPQVSMLASILGDGGNAEERHRGQQRFFAGSVEVSSEILREMSHVELMQMQEAVSFHDEQYRRTHEALSDLQALQEQKYRELQEQEYAISQVTNLLEEDISAQQQSLRDVEEQILEAENVARGLTSDAKEYQDALAYLKEFYQQRGIQESTQQGSQNSESGSFDPQAWLAARDNGATLQWPIEPVRGISAVFDDPGYKRRFGVEHRAIDIPAPQGTTIRAPRLGYVHTYADNGYGYSYVVIAHEDNLVTVYGHVTESLVEIGDVVSAGDPIALSGGAPGTKGAGSRTTGPHLHFEVYKDGVKVDPMNYLPEL